MNKTQGFRQMTPGAHVVEGGVYYHVWAPTRKRVEVEITGIGGPRSLTLSRDAQGYYSAIDPQGRAGDRYRYRLDGKGPFPDPASRWQPEGVHGPSQVIDPKTYVWADGDWKRPRFRDLVLYEIHIGTFTRDGTFRSTIASLPYLRDLGINAIQIMPVADFPGDRNWGYDGVSLFAPARCYGHPDDLRALVDAAHAHGLAVIQDVVYNHFGPDGNYLSQFSPHYFTRKHKTPWGDALNVDDDDSEAVRAFFIANAVMWMNEFHMDGLRLDATHAIIDDSPRHILQAIGEVVAKRGGYVIAEDERNWSLICAPRPEGFGLDAVYADDFCHTVQLAIGDDRFKADFNGSVEELADEIEHGWHYRGQKSHFTRRPRGGEGKSLPPSCFLYCISNHDQVGNRACGERPNQLTSPEAYRAASTLLLLSPYTPELFMGQEWAASTPFIYFTDHHDELGRLVSEGRRKEFSHHSAFNDPEVEVPDPQAATVFEKSKLLWNELEDRPHLSVLTLYRDCIALRHAQCVFRPDRRDGWRVANLGVVAIRYHDQNGDWLLLADLHGDHRVRLLEQPFCELSGREKWRVILSSNEVKYGGQGSLSFEERRQSVTFTRPEVLLLKSRL